MTPDSAPQHPLGEFEREELTTYAAALLKGALSRLDAGNAEGAAWRVADALGALSFITNPDTGGVDKFTGLGFKLAKVETPNEPR